MTHGEQAHVLERHDAQRLVLRAQKENSVPKGRSEFQQQFQARREALF